ncbi:MAG: hypothetical protein F7B17_02910 [Desulfurococcales archaeon]|nr:hypothetical protein [Desulfurococcales archaeon]
MSRALPPLLRSLLSEYKRLVKVYPDTPNIARRMFVTNAMDGLLAAIGVNVGGFSVDVDPRVLALSIMGGALSMGLLSAVVGVYLSERAERLNEVKRLEKKVGRSLRGSLYWRAAMLVPIYIALWSGVGVLVFPALTATPYLAASAGILGMGEAFALSLASALALMATLGYYLGVVSGESRLLYTLRGLALGAGGAVVVYLFKSLLQLSPIA